MKGIKCYIEEHYGVDHSKVDDKFKTKFVTVGSLFGGQPICTWCLTRLTIVSDRYGYSQQGSLRGNVINVEAKISQEELINRSPLKCVFADIDLADLKYQIDHNLFELEPQTAIQPPIQTEIDRISGARTVREV